METCRAVVWNLSFSCEGVSSAMRGQDFGTDLSSTLSDVSVRLAAVTVSMNIPPPFFTWELLYADTARIDE